jgi:hypothetical protein
LSCQTRIRAAQLGLPGGHHDRRRSQDLDLNLEDLSGRVQCDPRGGLTGGRRCCAADF